MKITLTPEQAERLRRVLYRIVKRTQNAETYGICQFVIEEIQAKTEETKDRPSIVAMGGRVRERSKNLSRRA